MININNKSKITFLSILTILSLSTIMPALVFAAPLANNGADWQYVNGNSWAQNYSPQTQIKADNVDELEVKWIFPLEGNQGTPAGLGLLSPGQGSNTPPVVLDGKVFLTTNYHRTYAIDAETGKQLWTHDYDVDLNEAIERLPLNFGPLGAMLASHLHGIRVWETGNVVLLAGLACDFYGIDVETGEDAFWVKDLCVDIPGNMYDYQQGAVSQTNIGTWEAGNQFIFVLPGIVHMFATQGDFRHTTMGIDMDTHDIIWRVFSYPPHGVLTKDWALQECDIGYFRDIPCSTVEAQAPENLEWDWAQPNQPPSIYGGVTANWGQIVVDEDSGILYTQTGNQGPYTYIGETPGPRLYGSTIMAIDMETGQRIWWQQPMPRDPYDYDCNWSGILADVPTLGKVYMKGCKEGHLNILDAETGVPIQIIDVVDEQYARGQISVAGTKEYQDGGIKYRLMDPLNHYDMREMVAPDGSPYCGDPCVVYPYWGNGIFSTDMTYDPVTATLFHYTGALQTTIVESVRPPWENNGLLSIDRAFPEVNSTIVARNVVTGEEKWSWYYDESMQRAAMVVTSNVLFTGFTDGYIRFFNSNTGELLREMNTGSIMNSGLTTGKDLNGDQKIFVIVASGGFGSPTPGTLMAIGLNDRAQAAATVTVTSTSRTTLTSIMTSTTTTTSTSVSTSVSTTTAQGQTQTQTQTVTSEVTGEAIGTITYAAIAVAVIAIIGAALLYTKKIKI